MTTVHILLATYNGERYLSEQLDSILNQQHANWTLTVSDDGSSDKTRHILTQFAKLAHQKVTVMPQHGHSLGPTANFFKLIGHLTVDSKNDLIAFCDQDDVWFNDKLTRAVAWHEAHHLTPIRLYCSRTQLVNDQLSPLGLSPKPSKPPSFGNALVQNIASGNTMVMNHRVLEALQKITPNHSVWHDWTTYLVATALGGKVEFDEQPSLLYRQHTSNVIGSNSGYKAQLQRVLPLLQGRYKLWSDITEQAVTDIHDQLPPQTIEIFNSFVTMRARSNPIARLIALKASSIRRQSLASNISLGVALLLGLA